MMRWILSTAALLAAFAEAQAQSPSPERWMYLDVPIHVEMPVVPTVFVGDDGRRYLAYHALITNIGRGDLVLDRLEVLDASNGKPIASFDSAALLKPALLRVSFPDSLRHEMLGKLASGRLAVLRLWLPLDASQAAPRRLLHRFTFASHSDTRIARALADTDAAPVLTVGPIDVRPAPVIIGPPLSGGLWRASGGPGPLSYHGAFTAEDGRARISERFAIDFQKVDSAGSILPNPFPSTISNTMFYSNRAEVLAVADGRIAFVRDGIPENVPTPSGYENMPVPLTRESAAGNQISIEIADGVFAQYAHLVPGMLRVRLGDRVRKGQVIGYVGNAGNAKNPHLHFEVADGPEIGAAQGIPWELDSFELWGHQGAAGMPDIKQAPTKHARQMLLQDAVVRFPGPPR